MSAPDVVVDEANCWCEERLPSPALGHEPHACRKPAKFATVRTLPYLFELLHAKAQISRGTPIRLSWALWCPAHAPRKLS